MHGVALLKWYLESGVDETLGDAPYNRFLHQKQPKDNAKTINNTIEASSDINNIIHHIEIKDHQKTNSPHLSENKNIIMAPSAAVKSAREAAESCNSVEELKAAVMAFEGCALKRTATQTVFGDGNPHSDIVFIGEAPGEQEDLQGIPFCGPSGKMLDTMLGYIDLDRSKFFISNTLYWRPPGNRKPSAEETAICKPFVERLIALINPKLLVLVGGTATQAVLDDSRGISRLRGKPFPYVNTYISKEITTFAIYHPSYLLRQPAEKRLAWQDLLKIRQLLDERAQ